MSRRAGDYRPHPKTAAMLRTAWAHVKSVPYMVSLRWLFYRLLSDGTFMSKTDYKATFLPAIAQARARFWESWMPGSLEDDTRSTTWRGNGYSDARDWLTEVASHGCNLDRWASQPAYIELWFEAAAMRSQFEHFTDHIPLRPFKGDPSIPFKWAIAKHLDAVAHDYPGKPIVILYFGDLDPKGMQIPLSAVADIRRWCSADFEFVRCGLNPGDERRFNLLENFEKPGTYQWEALEHDDAASLIRDAVARYTDPAAYEAVTVREVAATERFRAEIADLMERL